MSRQKEDKCTLIWPHDFNLATWDAMSEQFPWLIVNRFFLYKYNAPIYSDIRHLDLFKYCCAKNYLERGRSCFFE